MTSLLLRRSRLMRLLRQTRAGLAGRTQPHSTVYLRGAVRPLPGAHRLIGFLQPKLGHVRRPFAAFRWARPCSRCHAKGRHPGGALGGSALRATNTRGQGASALLYAARPMSDHLRYRRSRQSQDLEDDRRDHRAERNLDPLAACRSPHRLSPRSRTVSVASASGAIAPLDFRIAGGCQEGAQGGGDELR